MNRGGRVQIDVPENAAKPPEILILQPARITPAVHLDSQLVLSFNQIGGNIEFGGRKRIFAVPGQLSVDPHIKGGFHALKA
ncbi:hypothetical protein D3C76_1611790 [compost metagenome]